MSLFRYEYAYNKDNSDTFEYNYILKKAKQKGIFLNKLCCKCSKIKTNMIMTQCLHHFCTDCMTIRESYKYNITANITGVIENRNLLSTFPFYLLFTFLLFSFPLFFFIFFYSSIKCIIYLPLSLQ